MIQRSHGRLYPMVPPPDELPVGQAAQPEPLERRKNGQVAPGEAARALGKRGGQARARRRADAKAWGATLGLGRLLTFTSDEHVAPFVGEGESWLKAQCEAVARDVGGGQLSPGVVSILRTAMWQRLFSAWLFDAATRQPFAWDANEQRVPKLLPRTDLVTAASSLGDASRQNLLAAHWLAAKEAKARPQTNAVVTMRARILESGRKKA